MKRNNAAFFTGHALMLLLATAATPARAQDAIDRLDMRAHAAFDAGKYDDAIKYWTAALKLDPDNFTYQFNIATACEENQQPDKAIAAYTDAIRLDPGDPQVHLKRAMLEKDRFDSAMDDGKTDDADAAGMIDDYTQLIRLDPTAENYYLRASAYRAAGENEKAIADYTDVIRLQPHYSNVFLARASAYAATRDLDKAIADLTTEINDYWGYDYSLLKRGRLYLQKGDFDKALADANELVENATDPADAFILRGDVHAAQGAYDKAIADYRRFMDSKPDGPEGYNALARLYTTTPDDKIRDGAKAVEFAARACELSRWEQAAFIDTLAAAEAEKGDWENAVKHQKQAVDTARSAREEAWRVDDYASRLALYEQKKPYRQGKGPSQ